MALDHQTEMELSDVDELLNRHETAVLALAKDGEPYAIPISYGYDAQSRRFFIRLVSASGSRKKEFLSSTPSARLVVYEENDPIYRSVVAIGALREVPRDEITVDRIQQFGNTKRPLFEIWSESKPNLSVKLFELNPTELSGRQIVIADSSDSD